VRDTHSPRNTQASHNSPATSPSRNSSCSRLAAAAAAGTKRTKLKHTIPSAHNLQLPKTLQEIVIHTTTTTTTSHKQTNPTLLFVLSSFQVQLKKTNASSFLLPFFLSNKLRSTHFGAPSIVCLTSHKNGAREFFFHFFFLALLLWDGSWIVGWGLEGRGAVC